MGLLLDQLQSWRSGKGETFLDGAPRFLHASLGQAMGTLIAKLRWKLDQMLWESGPMLRRLVVACYSFHRGGFHHRETQLNTRGRLRSLTAIGVAHLMKDQAGASGLSQRAGAVPVSRRDWFSGSSPRTCRAGWARLSLRARSGPSGGQTAVRIVRALGRGVVAGPRDTAYRRCFAWTTTAPHTTNTRMKHKWLKLSFGGKPAY